VVGPFVLGQPQPTAVAGQQELPQVQTNRKLLVEVVLGSKRKEGVAKVCKAVAAMSGTVAHLKLMMLLERCKGMGNFHTGYFVEVEELLGILEDRSFVVFVTINICKKQ
jgi:hypothetical protein